jgi:hypothetical protein
MAGDTLHQHSVSNGNLNQLNLQRMRAGVAVLDHEINDIEVVEHKARGPVCARDGGVRSQRELAEDGGHERHIVGDEVEHGAVRAVGHRVEGRLREPINE